MQVLEVLTLFVFHCINNIAAAFLAPFDGIGKQLGLILISDTIYGQ